jgi:hypothetical protein
MVYLCFVFEGEGWLVTHWPIGQHHQVSIKAFPASANDSHRSLRA